MKPEDEARKQIDANLEAAGWVVQDYEDLNLAAGQGVAIREFPTQTGPADYLLFVDGVPNSKFLRFPVISESAEYLVMGHLTRRNVHHPLAKMTFPLR